jgi:adenylate kinase family enzyme
MTPRRIAIVGGSGAGKTTLGKRLAELVDGTFVEVDALQSSRVDVIVWLDLPLVVKLSRLLRRSWRRVRTREVLWNGNVETWRDVFVGRDSVVAHPLRTHFRHRRRMLTRSDQDKIVRLRSAREVDAWVSSLQLRRTADEPNKADAG